jgi:hypothetical protein
MEKCFPKVQPYLNIKLAKKILKLQSANIKDFFRGVSSQHLNLGGLRYVEVIYRCLRLGI